LATIRALAGDDKRVGFCLDTCHLYAAGFDLKRPDAYEDVVRRAEKELGLAQIRAFHLNDSKTPLGSHVDRHENIGEGTLGTEGFRSLMRDRRFSKVPMVLETPLAEEGYEKDLRTLRKLAE